MARWLILRGPGATPEAVQARIPLAIVSPEEHDYLAREARARKASAQCSPRLSLTCLVATPASKVANLRPDPSFWRRYHQEPHHPGRVWEPSRTKLN